MRVLIDAHMVGGRETGNETYIVNLLQELARMEPVTVSAAYDPGLPWPENLNDPALEKLPLSPSSNWGRLLYSLPRLGQKWQANLLHVTYIAPVFTSLPIIVSVHDVSFKRYPEFFSSRDRLLFRTLLPLTLYRAKAILTLSEHARKEICEMFPKVKDKVFVIPLAASPIFKPIAQSDSLEAMRQKYVGENKSILAVGNLQPRKNLARLIRAFAIVKSQLSDSLKLVIVGKAQWKSSKIYSLVNTLNLNNDVIFTGYIPDNELHLLYNLSSVFVYPSLYEGFGLPVLEAMKCGVPVVSSNVASMPEVAGKGALLVNPFDVNAIADSILKILRKPKFAAELAKRGSINAQNFSWHQTAQETTAIYDAVLKKHNT